MALATARIELDGVVREQALSDIDNLRFHPDRDVRRRGHEAADGARRTLAVPLAAAINSVKGQQLTLAHRRGWNEPLDAALAANAIDRATLDAIENRADLPPDMASKAKLHGGPGAGE